MNVYNLCQTRLQFLNLLLHAPDHLPTKCGRCAPVRDQISLIFWGPRFVEDSGAVVSSKSFACMPSEGVFAANETQEVPTQELCLNAL